MKCPKAGKIIHSTSEHAQAAVHQLQRDRHASEDLSVYRCRDHWHVGHDVNKLRGRIRKALHPQQ